MRVNTERGEEKLTEEEEEEEETQMTKKRPNRRISMIYALLNK